MITGNFKIDRDLQIWRLRHQSFWSLRRIGRKLGVTESAICRRIAYLEKKYGIKSTLRRGGPRRRRIRLMSLSDAYNV